MRNWFKLVATNEENEKWMLNELENGKLHYGWSPKGSNLIALNKLSWAELDAITLEINAWKPKASEILRKGYFLIQRIKSGDRIVVQLESPLRKFYIFEVTDGYKYSEIERDDFNHTLIGKLLCEKEIPLFSSCISNGLRHDLTKRGRYYQIYSSTSCCELDEFVQQQKWDSPNLLIDATHESEMEKMQYEIKQNAITVIRNRWQSKRFEEFVADLISKTNGVEIKNGWDSGNGWDLTITIRDNITEEVLYDDVPVQCKNYLGEVITTRPIEDLERCIKNSNKTVDIAYLFIFGQLKDQFYNNVRILEQKLQDELKRNIRFRIVDQDQIVNLYLKSRISL